MDVFERDDLPFPESLPGFQRFFPDDAACAAYLEKSRWSDGFACPHCGIVGDPFRFKNRPGVLRCRSCRKNTGLTVGTVMERSHMPLSVWFWAAYLVASQTPGLSAVQFQRRLGLSRYETAFGILHKLRSAMVRPDQDRIGGLTDQLSRWMRRGWADGRAARAVVFITKCWWPPPSKCGTVNRAPPRTTVGTVATPVGCVWRLLPTVAPKRWVVSSTAPSNPAR